MPRTSTPAAAPADAPTIVSMGTFGVSGARDGEGVGDASGAGCAADADGVGNGEPPDDDDGDGVAVADDDGLSVSDGPAAVNVRVAPSTGALRPE